MGWKGTVRSIGAVVRAAERDAKRRQRELEWRQKQYEKMQELERAAYEVERYENYMEIIQSLHKECSTPIEWDEISTSQQPEKPENSGKREKLARAAAETYQPGFFDRLFKKEEKKRKNLEDGILLAIKDDEAEYSANVMAWEHAVEDWKESVALARLIVSGDGEAKLRAIKELDPFSEISNLGSSLTASIRDDGMLDAVVHIHGNDIIPSEMKSLLQSGKLSVKQMPKGQFNEAYQDYVCSCVLRVANELLALIPDEIVTVTAVDDLLNTKTGHIEKLPILSARIPRETLKRLKMESIDPSDSMGNFIHNMSFKKTKGFEAVPMV